MADPPPTPPGPDENDAAPRRVQRRLSPLLLFFLALALVGYFVFTAVDGAVNRNDLDAQLGALRAELDELVWQADQLSALVGFLDSDEYIERTAREELSFVRPGEESFAILAPLRRGLPIVRSPWWANLLSERPAVAAE